ncbi:MAG: aminotransferase class III-fold pyridoxal phosphate-dependent enzyme, partial [Flavobacteriaceae bacterium]|nr:aminotransferase class III-fold pyridoxal phosphate-dependent enzyme [Flavobacteriaceae bacterium]
MSLFNVYPLFDITPVKAQDVYVFDENGTRYLDLYGGHAVISIGHSHPEYVKKVSEQLNNIGFYSNSIQNPLQVELADKLGKLSGCEAYQLFLCNSGAEANENALKLASFHTNKKKILAFKNSFHGRT